MAVQLRHMQQLGRRKRRAGRQTGVTLRASYLYYSMMLCYACCHCCLSAELPVCLLQLLSAIFAGFARQQIG